MDVKEQIRKKGYIDAKISDNFDFKKEIEKLKKEKNAIILAHYYVDGKIQDIADFTGDSLALSQKAAETDADIIVFAGVHFMAETAKILSPDKKVILPDLNAGCSLADSCPDEEFAEFIKKHPNHTVVSYVNTTAKVKALTDIICTSSNAKFIVDSIPKEEKIIFGPDRNLGNYISRVTGRDIVIWDGACHVHNEFSVEGILKLKDNNPEAVILAHPECPKPVLTISDYVGSTAGIITFASNSNDNKFIIATEPGVLHELNKLNPDKIFLPAPGEDIDCACNECEFMKMNSLEKLYACLKYEQPEINLDTKIAEKAYIPIKRMLDISAKMKSGM